MAYKGLDDKSPFKSELALLADEEGRDVMLCLVKATYNIDESGQLSIAEEQADVCFEGEYYGEPGKSSLKVAPEANFDKLATDVILIGHAHAPSGSEVTQLDVGLMVGPVRQHVRVFGDRVWEKRKVGSVGVWAMTSPKPFTTMPLIYERAFGGQDTTPQNEKHHGSEPRNLVGTGFVTKHSALTELPAPNIEDPKNLIGSISDRPQPMGFGFVSPEWEPRISQAGTYDESWQKSRMPLLPTDFNREFFSTAHPALKVPGFLNGNESVGVINACPQGKLQFRLPGGKPNIDFKFREEEPKPLEVKLDTVLINTDDMQLVMLWRTTMPVFNRVYDIEQIFVTVPELTGFFMDETATTEAGVAV